MTADTQTAGTQTAGTQTAGTQTAGTQTAGTQTAGAQTAGIDSELRQRVLASITMVLPHVLRGEQPDVAEGTRLMEDLGLTSTSTLELMLELEEDLQIQIDVEDIEPSDLASVGTLADFIASHALSMD